MSVVVTLAVYGSGPVIAAGGRQPGSLVRPPAVLCDRSFCGYHQNASTRELGRTGLRGWLAARRAPPTVRTWPG